MAEERSPEQKAPKSESKGSAPEKHGLDLLAAQKASSQYGKPTEPDVDAESLYDESADTHIYPADIGESATSYGDGHATIAPQLAEMSRAEAERNADPDAPNKEIARELGLDVD